jgi:hypothetical protein
MGAWEVLDIVHRDDVNGDCAGSPESRSSVRDVLEFPIAASTPEAASPRSLVATDP